VDVGRAGRQLQLVLTRDAGEILRLRGRGDVDRTDLLGLLDRLLRPRAGDDVIGGPAGGEQVHRHHRELGAGAALQEQRVVALGDARQGAEVGLGALDDFIEGRRAMADLEHRHTDARQGDEVALGLFQHRQGQHRRPRREVVDARAGGCGGHRYLLGCLLKRDGLESNHLERDR
jgi:hypothetical protein